MRVKYYAISSVDDANIRFAVIASRSQGKWVLCKHKERDTWEMPGGHREYGKDGVTFRETAIAAAQRELKEETGALSYRIRPVCVYSVVREEDGKENESLGLLAFAEIQEFGTIESEIEKIEFFDAMPDRGRMTYPDIQPFLHEKVRRFLAAEQKLAGIKAVIMDLDRTLLHTDKTLSDYTVSILEQCRLRGLKLVFATARPMRTVTPYLKQIRCDAVICHNGAVTMDGDKRIGKSWPVDIEKAGRLLRRLNREEPGRMLSIEINDTLYANFDVSVFWSFTDAVMTDFTDLPAIDADKVLIGVSGAKECAEIGKLLWNEVYGQLSDGKLCLVMNKNATKMNAVKQLAQYWGMSEESMLAFGDDSNDLEMLSGCGIGAAVANALDEIKEAADILVDSNDGDGVGRFLEQKFLKQECEKGVII